jgi:mannitol-specific phosphotransferase system IIBC component
LTIGRALITNCSNNLPLHGPIPLLAALSAAANFQAVGVKERRIVMKNRGFLWLLAILIGSALAFSPILSSPVMAQEKKEEKKDEKKKDEKKKEEKKEKSKKDEKKEEKKG